MSLQSLIPEAQYQHYNCQSITSGLYSFLSRQTLKTIWLLMVFQIKRGPESMCAMLHTAVTADPVAYMILLDTAPTKCVAGQPPPLTASGYKVWKLLPGQSYNLATRPTTGFSYTLSVAAGVVSSSSGSIY